MLGANSLNTSFRTPENRMRGHTSLRTVAIWAVVSAGNTVRKSSHGGASTETRLVAESQRTRTAPALSDVLSCGASTGTGVVKLSSKVLLAAAAIPIWYAPEAASRVIKSESGESGGCQPHGPLGGPAIPSHPPGAASASERCAAIRDSGSVRSVVHASAE